jgi:cytochrome P450
MCLKIRCDGWKRKYFGIAWEVNRALKDDMAYLRAVTKESLRIHNVTPLLAPYLSTDSCSIDGYMIPAGVQVLINSWAIGRDARY